MPEPKKKNYKKYDTERDYLLFLCMCSVCEEWGCSRKCGKIIATSADFFVFLSSYCARCWCVYFFGNVM